MKSEEEKDEAAIGHVVLFIATHPKMVIGFCITLCMSFGGYTAYKGGASTTVSAIERMSLKLDTIGEDVTRVKLTNLAILNTMPTKQKAEAQRIIALQLAAIEASRSNR